ncbi:hypothetical protein B0H13DRAFT_1864169 [Mycena leptocephala]|nr:hypothetical protein B0H13DRAFT_1864169 [Mycena leptocephala]
MRTGRAREGQVDARRQNGDVRARCRLKRATREPEEGTVTRDANPTPNPPSQPICVKKKEENKGHENTHYFHSCRHSHSHCHSRDQKRPRRRYRRREGAVAVGAAVAERKTEQTRRLKAVRHDMDMVWKLGLVQAQVTFGCQRSKIRHQLVNLLSNSQDALWTFGGDGNAVLMGIARFGTDHDHVQRRSSRKFSISTLILALLLWSYWSQTPQTTPAEVFTIDSTMTCDKCGMVEPEVPLRRVRRKQYAATCDGCGEHVKEEDKGNDELVVECAQTRCETRWQSALTRGGGSLRQYK